MLAHSSNQNIFSLYAVWSEMSSKMANEIGFIDVLNYLLC